MISRATVLPLPGYDVRAVSLAYGSNRLTGIAQVVLIRRLRSERTCMYGRSSGSSSSSSMRRSARIDQMSHWASATDKLRARFVGSSSAAVVVDELEIEGCTSALEEFRTIYTCLQLFCPSATRNLLKVRFARARLVPKRCGGTGRAGGAVQVSRV